MFCFIARKKISDSFGGGGALTPRVDKHVQSCAGCQGFLQQNQRLNATLDSEEPLETDLPPFFHRRMMHVLESEGKPAVIQRGLSVRAVVVACAGLVIGLGLLLHQAWQGNNAAELSEVERDSFRSLESGVEQVGQLVGNAPDVLTQPLAAEMQLLQEDLLTVAEKLDTHLNGAVFAMISPGNG